MNEPLTPAVQQRIQILHRYMCAMESGDVDTIATVLSQAEQDDALEHMILEANEVYQREDQTIVRPADVALAQQLLFTTIPALRPPAPQGTPLPSSNPNDNNLVDTQSHTVLI